MNDLKDFLQNIIEDDFLLDDIQQHIKHKQSDWTKIIKKLYSSMKKWLSESYKSGLVTYEEKMVEEDHIDFIYKRTDLYFKFFDKILFHCIPDIMKEELVIKTYKDDYTLYYFRDVWDQGKYNKWIIHDEFGERDFNELAFIKLIKEDLGDRR